MGLPQLEALAQAEARNLRRIDDLVDRLPDIAAALEECGDEDALCCLVICAICSRRLPVPIYSQASRHREVVWRPAQDRHDLSWSVSRWSAGGRRHQARA